MGLNYQCQMKMIKIMIHHSSLPNVVIMTHTKSDCTCGCNEFETKHNNFSDDTKIIATELLLKVLCLFVPSLLLTC